MKSAVALLAFVTMAAAGAARADAGEDLLKKDGCTACHSIDKKIIGPAYKDVANKYRGNAQAAAMLQEKVKKGGSGVWGASSDAAEFAGQRCRHQDARRLYSFAKVDDRAFASGVRNSG